LKLACLLSLFVTGALTASALAQQAIPRGKESVPAVKESTANSSAAHAPAQATPPDKESASGPNGATGAGAPTKGAEPIDTRITVQPRTTKKLPLGIEKKTSVPKAPPISAPTLQAIPHGANAPARNAIGVPLVDHARAHAPIHGPQEGRPPGALGSFGSAAAGMASHPSAAAGSTTARAPNPAAITGTGIARPGSGPGTLGGPAKNAAIINGTKLRPKP
jgi:hypothetical protein